jgi:hypothetical protein
MTNKLPDGMTEQKLFNIYCDYVMELEDSNASIYGDYDKRKLKKQPWKGMQCGKVGIRGKYEKRGLSQWLIRPLWRSENCTDSIIRFYKTNCREKHPKLYNCIYTKEERAFVKKPIEELWTYFCSFKKEYHKSFDDWVERENVHKKYPHVYMLKKLMNWERSVERAVEEYFYKNKDAHIPHIYDFINTNEPLSRKLHTDKKLYTTAVRVNFEKIKRIYFSDIEKGMSVDHIFTISSGFDFKVPVWIINCPSNLVIMEKDWNSRKGVRNDVTVSQLYANFFKYVSENKKYADEILENKSYLPKLL